MPCVCHLNLALQVEEPYVYRKLHSGDAAPQDVAHLVQRLCGGAETLIVVSSDLSHYHDYETEGRLDVATAAAIEHAQLGRSGPEPGPWLPRPGASTNSLVCFGLGHPPTSTPLNSIATVAHDQTFGNMLSPVRFVRAAWTTCVPTRLCCFKCPLDCWSGDAAAA